MRFHRILFTAATLLSVLGCNKKEALPEPEVYVQATHPTRGSISEQITADATLAPLAQAAISPRVTAPVKRFMVQRGSRVKAGQLLATLENSDLAAAALDSKGAYTAAQGTFETTTRAQVPEDTTKAQTDLAQAKANLDLSKSIVNGRAQLFAQGAIPGRDLDTAKAALVQAQSAYEIAKQHLDFVQQINHKAALQTAQGQLSSAEGKYQGAQAQLSYTEIRSPIDGVVTDRPLFAGETASAGTTLLTVMDTSALIAKLHIAQMQAQQLVLGAEASIAIPGISEPIPAKVSLISPALDPGSTTVEVWLRVENTGGNLKVGTPVHASITGRTTPEALLVPAEAVQTATDGRTKFVMVIASDGTASKKPITIGTQTAETVQVLSGITQQDMVITTGSYALDDKTKVKIGTPPDSAAGKDADSK
ncbi:efflux RND transporter periplasmic adaptor subunit [Granulicella arctica]|uniref:Multidrug efflux pump subunit AcrA (Membrane-fusion protein) n=1 Tax=Granulicella arctica TaxID=940613 RepID=A0A7Y9PIP0_9BACT|nr:efflux RND transporter periplasmic adaptor subunit [Granulicella arctica]NYF80475.1 multidrug efflux pump subunit AcrA (membrane-fusion protein) [Granulicella arctica]